MMARLEAEESFQTATRVAVGAGSLKPEASAEIQRGWAHTLAVSGGRRGRPAKVPLDHIRRHGIKVDIVPPKPKA